MTLAPILASAGQLALEKITTQEKKLTVGTESFNMPLKGEYEPSPSERVRQQVESYEATNGAEGGTTRQTGDCANQPRRHWSLHTILPAGEPVRSGSVRIHL